jgi:hypothetical protein
MTVGRVKDLPSSSSLAWLLMSPFNYVTKLTFQKMPEKSQLASRENKKDRPPFA